MINYIDAFLSIQKVKKDLKTMTFENAKDLICGYNETPDSFEFNRGNVCGSVYNENNKPVLKGESCFSVYDSEHTKNGIALRLMLKDQFLHCFTVSLNGAKKIISLSYGIVRN